MLHQQRQDHDGKKHRKDPDGTFEEIPVRRFMDPQANQLNQNQAKRNSLHAQRDAGTQPAMLMSVHEKGQAVKKAGTDEGNRKDCQYNFIKVCLEPTHMSLCLSGNKFPCHIRTGKVLKGQLYRRTGLLALVDRQHHFPEHLRPATAST